MRNQTLSFAFAMGLGLGIQAQASEIETVPSEVIVKLKKGVSKSFFNQKSFYGASLKAELPVTFGNLAVLKIYSLTPMEEIIKALNSDPNIEYAEPNYIYRAGKVVKSNALSFMNSQNPLTNDPMSGSLWGLANTGKNEPKSNGRNSSPEGKAGADIDAKRAWEITKGDKRVVIAVIDTGVDYNHPDLKDNMWVNEAELNGLPGVDDDGNGIVDDVYGARFHDSVASGNPMDGNGHGTHCAGTIAATHNNGIGVAGVMANASIMPVKFLTDAGSGTTADAVMAVDYATRMGADIMSNSWGGGGASQALEDAIRAANDAGIIFTAAAGNSGTNNDTSPHYPSNYNVPNVISVAAHDYADVLADFSCFGKRTVHVAAPGRNILSTVPNNGYEVYSGTSMATPHVTGVVGLLLSHVGKMNPEDVRERLMETSHFSRYYSTKVRGAGRVNAYNVLTDTREERDIPSEKDWLSDFSQHFESAHPYANGSKESFEIKVPGAKKIRVVFEKYELETRYDYVDIIDPNTNIAVERVTGTGTNYATEYVDGDTLVFSMSSDTSVNKWGYIVREIQYIR